MSDLISRQAAIEAMDECYWSIMGNEPPKLDEKTALYVDLKLAVKRLPTAEPEYSMDEWCTDCTEYDQERHCCPRFNRVIRDAVDEVKANQWIPCSERLPDEVGHYLCSFEEPLRIDRIHVDLAYWTDGRWYGYMADAITAWMPLPEPYTED